MPNLDDQLEAAIKRYSFKLNHQITEIDASDYKIPKDAYNAKVYRISPAVKSRIEGVVMVWMSSITEYAHEHGSRQVRVPYMRIDLSPDRVDNKYCPPLTINKKEYHSGSGGVKLTSNNYYRVGHGCIDFSDAAKAVYDRIMQDIAKDYINDERWQAQCVHDAREKVEQARQRLVKAMKGLENTRDGVTVSRSIRAILKETYSIKSVSLLSEQFTPIIAIDDVYVTLTQEGWVLDRKTKGWVLDRKTKQIAIESTDPVEIALIIATEVRLGG